MLDDLSASFSALLHMLNFCAWREPRVASAPLSTCRTLLSSLPCKPVLATWYGPSFFIGGGHSSWPLEVNGNIGFFKLVHCGTLWLSLVPIHIHCLQVETLCCPSLDWGGHSLLQIFLMTQSLDASVSSLMYVRLIGKSVL